MAVTVGDEFDSYEDFRHKISELERESHCLFVIDESRTVESANKLIKNRQKHYKEIFRYRYVKLCCKHYGKPQPDCHGSKRPNQS